MLEQMEFDFSPKEEVTPESSAEFRVELTAGWNGYTVKTETVTGTRSDAMAKVKELALAEPQCAQYVRDVWTMTMVPDADDGAKHLICDFGSWSFFGRVTRI